MHGTEVELNTLADTDRTGTKYQDFLFIRCCYCFILCAFIAVYRIVIWCCCRKLCSTGINHLVCCFDLVFFTKSFDFFFCFTCQTSNDIIRKFHALCFQKKLFCKLSGFKCIFHSNKDCQLINEPDINLGNVMKHGLRHTAADCFCDFPDSAVIYDFQFCQKFFICKLCKIVGHKAVYMLFQRTNCFHQSAFKVMADAHNLTGSFHLSRKGSLCSNKFVKWKSRNLHYAVVKHWLETCICFSCDRIRDLIQCVTQSNLCCNLCDRVTCCLTCKCRGTAYTRVYLDYTVFKAVRFQSVLNVTSTCDSKFCDDVQG